MEGATWVSVVAAIEIHHRVHYLDGPLRSRSSIQIRQGIPVDSLTERRKVRPAISHPVNDTVVSWPGKELISTDCIVWQHAPRDRPMILPYSSAVTAVARRWR